MVVRRFWLEHCYSKLISLIFVSSCQINGKIVLDSSLEQVISAIEESFSIDLVVARGLKAESKHVL